jgi:hypothetical protein
MLLVVQQNLSDENLQKAFTKVLDPRLVTALQDQIQLVQREMLGSHHNLTQRHEVILSELHNQSCDIKIILKMLKQYVNSPTSVLPKGQSAGVRQRPKLISNVAIEEQDETAVYKRASDDGLAELDGPCVQKLQEM